MIYFKSFIFSYFRFTFLSLAVLHITLSVVQGQSDSLNTIGRISAIKYFEKADTLITIKLNANNEFEFFKQEGDNFAYDIRPNIKLSNKLAFNYRIISFGIGFAPKFIPGNNDNADQGKTKAFTFGLAVNATHLIQELQIGRIQGFYLHNSSDFVPGWEKGKDPYLQLPDLVMASIRGSTSYKFNPNFSLKAISSQTEIQLRSCGSFIPSVSYRYYEIDNKSEISSQYSSQQSNNFEGLVNIGYYYTFVLNSKFYLSAALNPGIGLDYTYLTTRLPEGDQYNAYSDLVLRSQEKVGLGYNSKKLLAGAEFSIAHSLRNMNQTSVKLEAKRVYFQVFVGYRFTASPFIRHETDLVEEAVSSKLHQLPE